MFQGQDEVTSFSSYSEIFGFFKHTFSFLNSLSLLLEVFTTNLLILAAVFLAYHFCVSGKYVTICNGVLQKDSAIPNNILFSLLIIQLLLIYLHDLPSFYSELMLLLGLILFDCLRFSYCIC